MFIDRDLVNMQSVLDGKLSLYQEENSIYIYYKFYHTTVKNDLDINNIVDG